MTVEEVRPPNAPLVRIGDRVRSLVDDEVNIRVGLEGLVVNALDRIKRVRVLWDNETASLVDAGTLEILKED